MHCKNVLTRLHIRSDNWLHLYSLSLLQDQLMLQTQTYKQDDKVAVPGHKEELDRESEWAL